MKMRKEYIYIIILIVFVICVEGFKFIKKEYFSASPTIEVETLAADYSIEDFDIEIVVMENGDLKITENIIYNLKNNSIAKS